jgi:hypothetical protein
VHSDNQLDLITRIWRKEDALELLPYALHVLRSEGKMNNKLSIFPETLQPGEKYVWKPGSQTGKSVLVILLDYAACPAWLVVRDMETGQVRQVLREEIFPNLE